MIQGLALISRADLEVWVRVAWIAASQPVLELQAGEGVGTFWPEGDVCLSGFARELLERNLLPLLPPGRGLAGAADSSEGPRSWPNAPAMPPLVWWMVWR